MLRKPEQNPVCENHLMEGHVLRSFPTTDDYFLCWCMRARLGKEVHVRRIRGIGPLWAVAERRRHGHLWHHEDASLRRSDEDRSLELQLRISNHESVMARGLRNGL